MDYFERLGAALEDAWNEQNREEEQFPAAEVAQYCETSMFAVLHEDRDLDPAAAC
jgi:hypothetical protein